MHSPFMGKELRCFIWNYLLSLFFLILIRMNLKMFRESGDLKWWNVFQPSAGVVHNKASIATSFSLKTFSLEERWCGEQELGLYVKYLCWFIFKVKTVSVASTVGKGLPVLCPCQRCLVSQSSQGGICPQQRNLNYRYTDESSSGS